jgi:hypothetical protein
MYSLACLHGVVMNLLRIRIFLPSHPYFVFLMKIDEDNSFRDHKYYKSLEETAFIYDNLEMNCPAVDTRVLYIKRNQDVTGVHTARPETMDRKLNKAIIKYNAISRNLRACNGCTKAIKR